MHKHNIMIKSINLKTLISLLALFTLFSCQSEKKRVINFPDTDLSAENIIPKPLNISSSHDGFALDEFTAIVCTEEKEFMNLGEFLQKKVNDKTGLLIPINTETTHAEGIIFIKKENILDTDNTEAYKLKITSDSIILTSNTSAGAFRGIQTLRQIIPMHSNDTISTTKIWTVPTGIISDHPQFEYRGAMLDVARHFFSVEDVKKFIDVLAYYKYNALHLHLSDDQGWRIEIKSWPKLTEIGGLTEVGGEAGGFYTQEQYSDIVNYAAANHMMIVPEIDMPGHTNAASVCYPFLNGNGKELEAYTGTNVGFSTFDSRKDSVYVFIDDVIREIAALSPSPYFHIGGDESHVTKKKDYIYFVNKVEKLVQKHGKQMIGWDEIATTDVDATSISQFWHSNENAVLAVNKGMKIIMSPAKKAYLDMQYDSLSKHGLHWAAYIPTDVAYNWSPENYVDIPQENILGIEAPLWSETISNISELEYLAFPRAIGYAELGWTAEENRNWEDYKKRLAHQATYLKRMDVHYYASPLIDWESVK